MNERIRELALEAGMSKVVRVHSDGTMTIELPHPEKLERFAALVAAAERERCAQVCEDHFMSDGHWCAQAIRKGEK